MTSCSFFFLTLLLESTFDFHLREEQGLSPPKLPVYQSNVVAAKRQTGGYPPADLKSDLNSLLLLKRKIALKQGCKTW
jgi:hypothetical protein